MTIAFDGTGGLFTRVGRFYVAVETCNTLRGTDVETVVDDIVAQFASANQDIVSGIYQDRDSFRNVFVTFLSQLQFRSANGVIAQVNDDYPLAALTTYAAISQLITQMIANSETVNASSTSATPTAGTNTGTSVCLASTKGFGGKNREYLIPETIVLTASTDSQSGTVTAGEETWTITSPVAETDQLDWDWPKGSGVATSLVSANPGGSLNLIANGDFESFTTNTPANFSIVAGVAGTNIFQGGSGLTTSGLISGATNATPIVITTTAAHGLATGASVTIAGVGGNTAANGTWTITVLSPTTYSLTGSVGSGAYTAGGAWTGAQFRGTKCLKLTGTGAGVAQIRQVFGDSTGTTTDLLPLAVIAVHCWIKCDVVPAAGVLEIALTDADGTIIQDNEGTDNSITKTLSAATTSYASLGGFFRMPLALPTATPYYLRVRFSTDITSGRSLFIDDLCLAYPTESYRGGPWLAVFPGGTNTVVGDTQTVAVANTWGLAQRAFQMFFDMRTLGLQIPSNSAGGETIADSLFA